MGAYLIYRFNQELVGLVNIIFWTSNTCYNLYNIQINVSILTLNYGLS